MIKLVIGCVTLLPEGYKNRYFNVEALSPSIPVERMDKSDAEDLVKEIQSETKEIVDEIMYVLADGEYIYDSNIDYDND